MRAVEEDLSSLSPSSGIAESTVRIPLASAAVSVVLSFIFVPLSLQRLIAQDEGYYALAAKLVTQGRLVYRDFFYPQMPALPYVYGIWMKVFGFSWESGRALSAVLAVAIGLMLFQYLRHKCGSAAALAGVFLYATSSMVFPWFCLMKTYALSTVLLFGAYFLCEMPSRISKEWRAILVGLLCGLTVNVRLFFAVLFPVLLWALWRQELDHKARLKIAAVALAGFAVTFLPHIYFLAALPDAYWFNNLGYHFIRSARNAGEEWQAKAVVLSIILGLKGTKQFTGYQLPLLIYGTILFAGLQIRSYKTLDLAVPISLILFAVSFLPSPSYVQYFSALTPFLIVASVRLMHHFFTALIAAPLPGARGVAGVLLAVFLLAYSYGFKSDVIKYTRTGDGVIGIGNSDAAKELNITAVSTVSREIDRVNPGGPVISLWPGYFLPGNAQALAGLENHFGWQVADRISVEKRRQYGIMTPGEILTAIATGSVNTVVLRGRNKKYLHALEHGGYKVASQVRKTSVFVIPAANENAR